MSEIEIMKQKNINAELRTQLEIERLNGSAKDAEIARLTKENTLPYTEKILRNEVRRLQNLLNAYRVLSAGTNLRMKIDLLSGMENTGYVMAAARIREDWNAEFVKGLEEARDVNFPTGGRDE